MMMMIRMMVIKNSIHPMTMIYPMKRICICVKGGIAVDANTSMKLNNHPMMNMMLVGECESSDSENKECDTRCNGKSEFSYRNGNVYYLSIADDIYGR